MKNSLLQKLVIAVALLCTAAAADAQTSGCNSPYSRYGWGSLADESQSFNLGMGSVALGFRGPGLLNTANPAALSAVDSLTFLFDLGTTLTMSHMTTGDRSVNANNSTFDRAATAFRLRPRLGLGVGIRPVSYVGYEFSTTQSMEDVDGLGEKTATYNYGGDGGIRQVYVGLGWEPIKRFSVGVNVGYIWGEYRHTSNVTFSETAIRPLTRTYFGDINTYSLDFGAQYVHDFNKETSLTLGLVAGLGHNINMRAGFLNLATTADTTYVTNAYELPTNFGGGLTFNHANKWIVGLDYTCQLWKGCRAPMLVSDGATQTYTVSTDAFSDRHKIAAGLQYMPNPLGFRFRHHIAYRAGVSYTTPYTKVNGHDGPASYSASVGIGLPISNRYTMGSVLSIAAEYRRVEPSLSSHITENYFSLHLGLHYNARWFSKWQAE